MEDFLHMGGYAVYVWSSYGLGFAVIIWNLWSALKLQADARDRALKRLVISASNDADPREP